MGGEKGEVGINVVLHETAPVTRHRRDRGGRGCRGDLASLGQPPKSARDHSLIDVLLQSNPEFQSLVAKSKAKPGAGRFRRSKTRHSDLIEAALSAAVEWVLQGGRGVRVGSWKSLVLLLSHNFSAHPERGGAGGGGEEGGPPGVLGKLGKIAVGPFGQKVVGRRRWDQRPNAATDPAPNDEAAAAPNRRAAAAR